MLDLTFLLVLTLGIQDSLQTVPLQMIQMIVRPTRLTMMRGICMKWGWPLQWPYRTYCGVAMAYTTQTQMNHACFHETISRVACRLADITHAASGRGRTHRESHLFQPAWSQPNKYLTSSSSPELAALTNLILWAQLYMSTMVSCHMKHRISCTPRNRPGMSSSSICRAAQSNTRCIDAISSMISHLQGKPHTKCKAARL